MKKIFTIFVALVLSSALAFGAGVTKYETGNKDAGSAVLYGTPDSGSTIVRVKTTADGTVVTDLSTGTHTFSNVTVTGTFTTDNDIVDKGLTASQAVMTDANKKLVSADYLNQAVKTTSAPTFAGGNITGVYTTQNIIPVTTNLYTLGDVTHLWANIYATTGNVVNWVISGSWYWTGGRVHYLALGTDINAFIASASCVAGDTIVLGAGTYTITSMITVAKKVCIIGQGMGITTITCSTDLAANGMFYFQTQDGSYLRDCSVSYTAANITGNTQIIGGNVNYTLHNVDVSSTASPNGTRYIYGVAQNGAKTIDMYNVHFNGSGAVAGNFMTSVTGAAGAGVINMYSCSGVSSNGTSATYGTAVVICESATGTVNVYGGKYNSATNTANGVVNCINGNINLYNVTANGSGATAFDVQRTAGTLTLYNTTLVNNTTSGTITYGGTVQTSGVSGSVLINGSTYSVQKQHDEIGILLDVLTAPKAIVGFTGTGAAAATEAGYESGAGRVWTYSGGLAADKIFKGSTYVYSFDGVDSRLVTPDTADMTFSTADTADTAFSIGAWVQVVNTAALQAIFSKGNGTTSGTEYVFAITSDEKLILYQNDNSVTKIVNRVTDSALSVGWHFVVATQSGTGGATAMNTCILYVDGVAVASTATNDAGYVAMENSAQTPAVGARASGDGEWFAGDMGRLFVTGEALSAASVWRLYEKTRGYYNQ